MSNNVLFQITVEELEELLQEEFTIDEETLSRLKNQLLNALVENDLWDIVTEVAADVLGIELPEDDDDDLWDDDFTLDVEFGLDWNDWREDAYDDYPEYDPYGDSDLWNEY